MKIYRLIRGLAQVFKTFGGEEAVRTGALLGEQLRNLAQVSRHQGDVISAWLGW